MTDPSTLKLLALAALQGLTEFLPVSSSGHLALAGRWLGVESPGPALELLLHVGTLASVLVFYRRRVAELVSGLLRGGRAAWAFAGCIVLSMLPAAVFYACCKDAVRGAYDAPRAVGALLLVNAALLLLSAWTDRRRPGGGPVGPGRALAMGVGQALAVLPGISRSGTSIHAGRLFGVGPREAAEFSFLMSVPAIAGGALLEALGAEEGAFSGVRPLPALLALAVSALVGLLALRIVVGLLVRGRFWTFGLWCSALGAAALLFG